MSRLRRRATRWRTRHRSARAEPMNRNQLGYATRRTQIRRGAGTYDAHLTNCRLTAAYGNRRLAAVLGQPVSQLKFHRTHRSGKASVKQGGAGKMRRTV